MPASPNATAQMLATASCVPVASTSGSATGASQVVIGVHTSANWIHPPKAASTASTATVSPIDEAVVARVRRVLADVRRLLAAEDDEQHPERVQAGEERAGDGRREQDVAEP